MGITNFDKVQANEFIGADFSMTGDVAIGNSATADTLTINALTVAGTAATPIVNDTADTKFYSLYADCGATSGDARANYTRLYITGAGGGGEALRVFTTVDDVAGATARGAHISLNFDATGSVTGLGAAINSTVHVPDAALTGGTYTSAKTEVWADGSSSDISGATAYSVQQFALGGDATGVANIDANAFLFDFSGFTAGSGNMIDTDITALTGKAGIRVSIDGVAYGYIPVVTGS